MPEPEVILVNKPANNGEALLVCDAFKDVVVAKGESRGKSLSRELTP